MNRFRIRPGDALQKPRLDAPFPRWFADAIKARRTLPLLLVAALFPLALGACKKWGLPDGTTLLRNDHPITREEAQMVLNRSLPPGATDIYALSFSGGLQDLEFFLRFDLPQGDLEAAAQALIADNAARASTTYTYETQPIPPAHPVTVRPEFLPLPWWDPDAIAHGSYLADQHLKAYSLRIWIDQDQRRIYVYQND